VNRPSPPPEAAKLLEAALDVFVYAPIGFLLDARDVVPKLAERGRGQVTLARMFGRYALQLGQAEAERVLNRQHSEANGTASATEPAAAEAATPPTAPPDAAEATTEAPSASSAAAALVVALGAGLGVVAAAAKTTTKSTAKATSTTPKARATAPKSAPAEPTAAPAADQLPIPGYDTLSASQVVPRLDALLPGELEAVRAYESANRGRRTILNRIAQRLA